MATSRVKPDLHPDHQFYARGQLPDHWATLPLNTVTNHVKLIVLNHFPDLCNLWSEEIAVCMTTGVDSSEKTSHTTFDNEWKFSWDSKTRTKTMGLRHNRLFRVIFT